MSDNIHIKKADFRFGMDSEEMAFNLYSSWSSFYGSAFVRIVEKVLERFNPSGELLSIGMLELDLGTIPRNGFYTQFPLLLEEKLEELMQKLIVAGAPGGIKKVPASLSFFEAVTWFLIHGYYPWPGIQKQKNFKVLFLEILQEYTRDLCEFLRTYGHYSSLRRRLALLLNNGDLQQLVKALAPAESGFIISYFNLLINESTHEKVATATVKDHRDACWEVILSYLLAQKAGHFNRRAFIDQTIHGLAAHYGLEYIRLLHFLTDVVLSLNIKTDFHSEFRLLLTELNEAVAHEAAASDHNRLFPKEFSDAGTIKNRSSVFNAEQHKEQLLVLLKQPQSRRRLIRQLNEKQLHGLVKLLVPGEERFVISYAGMLDRQHERNAFEGHTAGEFNLLKWEFILTVLIEETGNMLNRKAFVYSVISMLAAHYNLTVYDLLRLVYQTLIDRLIIADKVLAGIISELYFEEKEKKEIRNEPNLFDQALRDEFYWKLVRKQLDAGILPKHKISLWLRSAPHAVQLKWMHAMVSPYHRQVLNDAFRLLQWIKETVAGWSGVSFNRQKVFGLLLEFSSGKNQNRTEKDLLNALLHAAIGPVTGEQWQQLLSILKIKAANRGRQWEQKMKWLEHSTPAAGTGNENTREEVVSHEYSVNQNNKPIMNEEIFINNAGLVLCNPFLPRLFSLSGLTGENGFKDAKSAERAVLLLQYLLFESTEIAEHELVLNKLLCGLAPAIPVDCTLEVTPHEAETMQQLLQGIIQNWGRLGNTSPRGLVDSFLIREGKLEKDEEDIWHLKIEQKGYDVLLDSLPWSYSPVKYSWMDKPIYVSWR